jgi:hypothetical protein
VPVARCGGFSAKGQFEGILNNNILVVFQLSEMISSSKVQFKNCFVLFSLPSDLLPFIFSFLSPKELCCFDSAILNHTDRPLFLSALIQRFKQESELIGEDKYSLESKAHWYLCRRVPITSLFLQNVPCPKGIISMNSEYLKEIRLCRTTVDDETALAFAQCSKLKKLRLAHCSPLSGFNLDLILQNTTTLEKLLLENVSFSRTTAEIISRHCRSLKDLQLSSVHGVGDEELRLVVEGCPHLRSLHCFALAITEDSVAMLMNHHPRILSIGIQSHRVSVASMLSLLKKFTIPTLFDFAGDQELCISALVNLTDSIPFSPSSENPLFLEALSRESLLERMMKLLSPRNPVSPYVIIFFCILARKGYHRVVAESGFVSLVIRDFKLFPQSIIGLCLNLFQDLSKPTSQRRLLTSGFLSLFRRLHRLIPKVRK